MESQIVRGEEIVYTNRQENGVPAECKDAECLLFLIYCP